MVPKIPSAEHHFGIKFRRMTKEDAEIERRFEAAVKASGVDWVSLAKPYMEETRPGYDSAYTQHMFDGFKLGIAAQAAKIAELEEELRECKNELESCCYRDRVAKKEIVDWQKEAQKARFDLAECKKYWGETHAKLAECQARIEQYEKDVT